MTGPMQIKEHLKAMVMLVEQDFGDRGQRLAMMLLGAIDECDRLAKEPR